jgi:hypothetical protein
MTLFIIELAYLIMISILKFGDFSVKNFARIDKM